MPSVRAVEPLEHKDERLHAAAHADWRDALAVKRRELARDEDDGDDGGGDDGADGDERVGQ